MDSAGIATQALAVLGPVVTGGARVVQGITVKVLGDLIEQRLSRTDTGKRAWTGFRTDPRNDSLIHHLLQQELESDPAFRSEVEKELRRVGNQSQSAHVRQTMTGSGSGNVQVGNTSGHIATSGGRIDASRTTTKHKKSNGTAVVGVVAIVVVLVVAVLIVGGIKVVGSLLKSSKDGGLTASSTCQQFLNTDEDDERQALADIGVSEGFSVYSSPLALPEIQYECGAQPTTTLGALIKHDGNMGE
jgi:hypothetical protein